MSSLEKTINYLLIAFITLLPWQTRWIIKWGELGSGYSEYLRISLYASSLLLLLLLGAYLYWKFTTGMALAQSGEKAGNAGTALFVLVGLFEMIVFLSIFWADDKSLAIYKYLIFLAGIGLFWLLKEGFIKRLWLEAALVSAGLLQAILAIAQFLTQTSLHNKWLGLALHHPGFSGTAVVTDFIGNRYLRSYGAFDHPNILGGFLAMSLVLVVVMLLREKVWQNRELKYYLLAALPIMAAGLFYTFSRAAWLAAAAAVVLLLLFAALRKNQAHIWKIFLSFLLSSLTVVILGNMMIELILTRVQIDNNVESRSVDERVLQYREANAIIESAPFGGVGAGNYVPALIKTKKAGDWYDFQPVHNTFMLAWAELGIFGFMALLGLLYYIFTHRQKLAYQNSLLVVVFVLLLFDHWFWSFHFGLLFLWLILGMVVIRKEKERGK